MQYLFNLDIDVSQEILDNFRDIKYVCLQGSGIRAKEFAQKLAEEFLFIKPNLFMPQDLFNNRFSCYKVGNILSVSHGMGTTSAMTILYNLTYLLNQAQNYNFEYIRMGTCGGINLKQGSIVITNTAYSPDLTPGFTLELLGKKIFYPAIMNKKLNQKIISAQPKDCKLYQGNTIAADDFYLGQARFDGAIKPWYNLDDRNSYFEQLKDLNILNFEMESTAIGAFCGKANIPAAVIAVTLLDRNISDQVSASLAELNSYTNNLQQIMINYIKSNSYEG